MNKHLFGPVPSRRLGMSLGIDLVPHKVCSLNCIYCECGRTTNLTLERKEYVSYDEVVAELEQYFSENIAPDYITFSGSGEPTLNVRIGDILHFIKQNYSNIPVALLTNGTLLTDKKVRDSILEADVVLPSLDAVSDLSFRKINRPYHLLDVEKHIQGLIDFRKEFSGKIWLEVFIVPGINDNETELGLLKDAILKISPDSIQLNTLDRPGTVENIKSATRDELEKIVDFWGFDNVEIISLPKERKKIQAFRKDIETAILETIARRPCTLIDISNILGLHINEINKYLDVIEEDNKIESVQEGRGLFYRIK